MDEECKANRFRISGWILGGVGLTGVLGYHFCPVLRRAGVLAMGWSFLVYGGLLQHSAILHDEIAELREKVAELESRAGGG